MARIVGLERVRPVVGIDAEEFEHAPKLGRGVAREVVEHDDVHALTAERTEPALEPFGVARALPIDTAEFVGAGRKPTPVAAILVRGKRVLEAGDALVPL